MYLSIIVLPLLGSIVSGFFGRKVGVSGAQLVTCLCVIITTFIAIIAFVEVALNNLFVSITMFRWIDTESLNIMWGFNFDSLTVTMLIPVLIISTLVHIYSVGYMSHDPHNQRFFSYLSLFTFMMIILVTANNFLLMFVGWEGVGVCSYLLVNFWYTRIAANQSSMSAFLTNRVGDCFLTIGMFTIIWTFGNLDYSTVFSLAPFINENAVTLTGICLLVGAMAKSSQVGLHVWLPLAMEGPTPVSALIHAATMVTAGVYLLMRSSPLIEYSSTVLILCLWIGSITTLFSSLIGLFQQDIKKVIAYSTMSQLGMMVIAVGLSSYNLALFHLVNHAFYKGLLFLGAGAVIHAVSDNQDFRKYGGLIRFLPLSYTVMLIASLSLVAFPFMTGFYSKDFILESAFGQFSYYSITVYFIAVIGAMFTTMYSIKVLYLTFISKANGSLVSYKKAHESDIFMSLPLIILAIFSVFFGHICKDIFIGLGTGLFTDNSLFIHPVHEIALNTEFGVSKMFKLLPFFFTIFFTLISISFLEFIPKVFSYFKSTRLGYNLFNFFSLRFLIEYVYNRYITRFMLKIGGQTTKVLDKGSVELLGPHGLEILLVNLSKNLSKLDTGVVTSYALYILIGLITYMLIPYVFYNDINTLVVIIFILASLFSLKRLSISNTIGITSFGSKVVMTSKKPKIKRKQFGSGRKNIIDNAIDLIGNGVEPGHDLSSVGFALGLVVLGLTFAYLYAQGTVNPQPNTQAVNQINNLIPHQEVFHALNRSIHVAQNQVNGALGSAMVLLSDSDVARINPEHVIRETDGHMVRIPPEAIIQISRNVHLTPDLQAARMVRGMQDLRNIVNTALPVLTDNLVGFRTAFENTVTDRMNPLTIIGPNGIWFGSANADDIRSFIDRLVDQHQYIINTAISLTERIEQFSTPNNGSSSDQFRDIINLSRRLLSLLGCEQEIIVRMLEITQTTEPFHLNTATSPEITGMFGSGTDITGILPDLEPLHQFIFFSFI